MKGFGEAVSVVTTYHDTESSAVKVADHAMDLHMQIDKPVCIFRGWHFFADAMFLVILQTFVLLTKHIIATLCSVPASFNVSPLTLTLLANAQFSRASQVGRGSSGVASVAYHVELVATHV
jgi:hypothetical protein